MKRVNFFSRSDLVFIILVLLEVHHHLRHVTSLWRIIDSAKASHNYTTLSTPPLMTRIQLGIIFSISVLKGAGTNTYVRTFLRACVQ